MPSTRGYPPPSKRAKIDSIAADALPVISVAEKLLLNRPDIWVNDILASVGPGHFIYVALVCRQLKALYKSHFATIEKLPMVKENINEEEFAEVEAIVSNTFYAVSFSSVPCARFWDEVTKFDPQRCDYVCFLAAKYGNLQILKWARRQGFPWDEYTCSQAAMKGHFKLLQWAHEND